MIYEIIEWGSILGVLFLIVWFHVRLLSDKTKYDKIRDIVRSELENVKRRNKD